MSAVTDLAALAEHVRREALGAEMNRAQRDEHLDILSPLGRAVSALPRGNAVSSDADYGACVTPDADMGIVEDLT